MTTLPRLTAVLLVALVHARAAIAQTVELEGGVGYVFGGGIENPSPSLTAFNIGVSVWPWERWGLAVRWLEAPGETLYDQPAGGGDRTFVGEADLHYVAVGARRRWALSPRSGFELGFGMALDGRFSTVVDFADPAIGRQTYRVIFFETLLVEGYHTRALGRRFAIKSGLSYDTNVETSHLQPLVLGALRF